MNTFFAKFCKKVSVIYLLLVFTTIGEIIPAPFTSLPPIGPNVGLSPSSVSELGGRNVGPIHGVTYNGSITVDRNTFNGGSSGWVTSTFTNSPDIGAGNYRLFFMVTDADFDLLGSGAPDETGESGLAIDRITISGNTFESFEDGIPTGWQVVDATGTFDVPTGALSRITTSPAVANEENFQPTDGNAAAILDNLGTIDDSITPAQDGIVATNGFGGLSGFTSGSTLLSEEFFLDETDVLELDLSFLTNDVDPFIDMAIVQLVNTSANPFTDQPAVTLLTAAAQVVPEPSTYLLFAVIVALFLFGVKKRGRLGYSNEP